MTPTTIPTPWWKASIRSTRIFRISESGGTGEIGGNCAATLAAHRIIVKVKLRAFRIIVYLRAPG
jgi:hypothetical protein